MRNCNRCQLWLESWLLTEPTHNVRHAYIPLLALSKPSQPHKFMRCKDTTNYLTIETEPEN